MLPEKCGASQFNTRMLFNLWNYSKHRQNNRKYPLRVGGLPSIAFVLSNFMRDFMRKGRLASRGVSCGFMASTRFWIELQEVCTRARPLKWEMWPTATSDSSAVGYLPSGVAQKSAAASQMSSETKAGHILYQTLLKKIAALRETNARQGWLSCWTW